MDERESADTDLLHILNIHVRCIVERFILLLLLVCDLQFIFYLHSHMLCHQM
jgi:hypothetical protein